jgi:hypothetical protein
VLKGTLTVELCEKLCFEAVAMSARGRPRVLARH